MSDINLTQPKINSSPVPASQPVPLPAQEDLINRASSPEVVSQEVSLLDRSVEESDDEMMSYYDIIKGELPEDLSEEVLGDLEGFSKDLELFTGDDRELHEELGDLIFDLFQTVEVEEGAKVLPILQLFCNVIFQAYPKRDQKISDLFNMLKYMTWMSQSTKLAKLTILFKKVQVVYDRADYVGSCNEIKRFFTIEKKVVSVLAEVIELSPPNAPIELTPSKREKVVLAAMLLFGYITDRDVNDRDLSSVIRALCEVDESQVLRLAECVDLFLSCGTKGNTFYTPHFVEGLSKFSVEDRDLLVMLLQTDFQNDFQVLRLDIYDFARLLEILKNIPSVQWRERLKEMIDLKKCFVGPFAAVPFADVRFLQDSVEKIGSEAVCAFFEMVSSKLQGTKIKCAGFSVDGPVVLSQVQQTLFKGLFDYPVDRVASLLDKLKPFLEKNLESFFDLIDILVVLLEIEPENLDEAVSLVCSVVKGSNNGRYSLYGRFSALMRGFAIEQLRVFCPLLRRFVNGLGPEDAGIYELINALGQSSFEERVNILSVIAPHMSGLSSIARAGIFRGLLSIPAAEREDTFWLARPYISAFSNRSDLIFNALADVPMERRSDLIDLGKKLLGSVRNFPVFYNFCNSLLRAMSLDDVAHISDDLWELIVSIPQPSARLLTYLNDQMQYNPEREKIKLLADFVARNRQFFGFDEDHEIVQLAIRTSILLLGAETDLLNPYNIFRRLEDKRAELVNWDIINPITEILGGLPLSFNPSFFGSEMKEIVIRKGQLPKVPSDFLGRHLSALKDRFASVAGLIGKVNELTGFNFAYIEEHALHDQFLLRHLSFEGAEDAIVPITTARFIAIAAYIETLSEVKNPGDDFSEKEVTFIKMLGSIMFCSTGKSDGVGNYYLNILPASFRYGQGAGSDSRLVDLPHDQSKLLICEILSEEIEKMFSGQNVMMKQIVGIRGEEVQQASHQGYYLRNLLGRDLLGSTKVYFDAHTQELYENLVALGKQDAMQIFFTHFKPSAFIQLVAKKFDLDLEETLEELVRLSLFKSSAV